MGVQFPIRVGQSVSSGADPEPYEYRSRRMPPRTPRHLAEHRLPWRLMLVAFGLTFAVLAAMVASAALVPEEPLVPSAVAPVPADTGPPFASDPSSVAPSTADAGGPTTTTTAPEDPPSGSAPVLFATRPRTTAAPGGPTGPPNPPATAGPSGPTVPSPTEPPPGPLSTVEPTTTTVEPTTITLEPTTTTTVAEPTTTAEPATTTTTLVLRSRRLTR
jgi:hypothetical protein